MSQIVKTKKKGRPSKADLAARRAGESPAEQVRRSLRRRNVKYTIDYDDYLDYDSDHSVEDEEIIIQKKLKLMAKLHPEPPPAARERHALESESESESEYERKPQQMKKPLPIRREESEEEEEYEGNEDEDEDGEERNAKPHSKQQQQLNSSSPPGTPSDQHRNVTPLPDKKTMEFILDKLQKKDIYGVYADPVDPDELPDYYDVIEHPMDFTTVRKQLANGTYSTLEQFESDVFLICSNAMQYNSSDTIYHKQALSIQELGRRKFQRLRIAYERSEKEVKSVEKTKSNSFVRKQIKKPLSRTLQEPIGSDFSSGATLANVAEVQKSSQPTQGTGFDLSNKIDGPVEGILSFSEASLEKTEEMLSGKSPPPKAGKKPSVPDDDRRATYNISCEPVIASESIFTTFEGETKQFIAVGLHAEYAYARSLARFSGSLGPVAWKVASKRIELALPDGCKFGRGWVEEYEPLPTPVLMVDKGARSQSVLPPKFFTHKDSRKDNETSRTSVPAKEDRSNTKPAIEERQQRVKVATSASRPLLFGSSRGCYSEEKPSVISSNGTKGGHVTSAFHQQKNPQLRYIESEKQVPKKVELNSVPSANQNSHVPEKQSSRNSESNQNNLVPEKESSRNSESEALGSRGTALRNMNTPQRLPFKMPDSNGVVTSRLPNGIGAGAGACVENRMISSGPYDRAPGQMGKTEPYFSHSHEQGLSDPVQLMKKLRENTQKQQNSSTQPSNDTRPVISSVPSPRRDNPSDAAAAAAAHAWMSIGGGAIKQPTNNPTLTRGPIFANSLYNPSQEFHSQMKRVRGEVPNSGAMQFQTENSFSFPTFLPQPVHIVNEPQFQNRPIFFPQLAADLSRFQVPPPWRAHSPCAQPRQKHEGLPPDLNIGFQSPGSPVKQSSGHSGVIDSQQPDLALQL